MTAQREDLRELLGQSATVRPPAVRDSHLRFELPDGRAVCLTVPAQLTRADAQFIASVTGEFVAALVQRAGC